MNIRKNFEEEVLLQSIEGSSMLITRKQVDCYCIEIAPDNNQNRTFIIPFNALMNSCDFEIYKIFKNFISAMFENNNLHGGFNNRKLKFDNDNGTIAIESDAHNNSFLTISFSKEEIKFQITKSKEDGYNHAIYFYSDCNLRWGYIGMFRELYDSLNNLALEQEKPEARIKKMQGN